MAQNIARHVTKFGLFAQPTSLEDLLIQLKKSMDVYPLGSRILIEQIIDKFPAQAVKETLSKSPDLNSEAALNLVGILEQTKEERKASPAKAEEEHGEAALATNHM